ncbi:MAG: thiamine pyrophosphate-binding protein [Pseudomonadota bacterium]
MKKMTGGGAIVAALEAQGVKQIFCVPGESYLAVLDALHDSPIKTIACRHESGASMMADSEGRLTGQPGVAFVTRGPGTMNALAGLHIARQDSIPLVLFIGQVQSDAREREAFQEIEYRRMLPEVTKWVAEIDRPERVPEMVARAFAVARSGRPGPVALALPEDMLRAVADVPTPPKPAETFSSVGDATLDSVIDRLKASERPIAILGGTGWTEASVLDMQHFAQAWSLPVACSFRRQMLFDHEHPCYAGDSGIGINPKLAARIKTADTILLIGGRYGEMPSSGYTLLNIPTPDQFLIHVHPSAEELGRVYSPDIAIKARPSDFISVIAGQRPDGVVSWESETLKAHSYYLNWSTPPKTGPGDLLMGPTMSWLNTHLSDDAIITNGAGNYATWIHRFYRFRRFGTQSAPACGSMGYGLPAALSAKHLYPEREVVCFAGDGCFLMTGQEFATAVQYHLPVIVIVVDNGMYGTIRMHQERDYPGRVSGTDLINPDFAAYARAFGGFGETVGKTEEFAPAFEAARQSRQPAILHLKLDPQAITPTRTLDEIRDAP